MNIKYKPNPVGQYNIIAELLPQSFILFCFNCLNCPADRSYLNAKKISSLCTWAVGKSSREVGSGRIIYSRFLLVVVTVFKVAANTDLVSTDSLLQQEK